MSEVLDTVGGWEVWRVDDGETHWLLVQHGEGVEAAIAADTSAMWVDADPDPRECTRATSDDLDRVTVRWEGDREDETITLREAAANIAAAIDRGGSVRLISSTCY